MGMMRCFFVSLPSEELKGLKDMKLGDVRCPIIEEEIEARDSSEEPRECLDLWPFFVRLETLFLSEVTSEVTVMVVPSKGPSLSSCVWVSDSLTKIL